MRYLLLLPLFLAACSESALVPEPAEPQTQEDERAIAFGAHKSEVRDEANTRDAQAPVSLSTVAKDFKAWGFKTTAAGARQSVFTPTTGYLVEWVADDDTWTYTGTHLTDIKYLQHTKYWDLTASSYLFFGVAPFAEDTRLTFKKADNTTTTDPAEAECAEVSFAVDNTKTTAEGYNLFYSTPVVVAQAGIAAQSLAPVPIIFQQPMTRVRIMFVYPTTDDGFARDINPYNFGIENLKFAPVAEEPTTMVNTKEKGCLARATITVAYPLDGSAPTTTTTQGSSLDDYIFITEPYEEAIAPNRRPPHAMAERTWYTVVPMAAQSDYRLEGIFNGTPKACTVPATDMTWQAGHEYTYIFRLTDTSLSFDCTLDVHTKWQAGYVQDTEW